MTLRPRPSSRQVAAIRARLLAWYRAHRRRLPWRERHDPYRVWVAEIMLQQTQVAMVIPYYARFLKRFPDLASLAAADEDEVTAVWSGLGYYTRARRLHRAAREVMERHGGRLPACREDLEALPGIGRYTAGAILSIAFGQEEPIVDGNVRRLLTRVLLPVPHEADAASRRPKAARRGRPRSARPLAPSDALLEAHARALLRGAPPSDLNQALMELGALVCRPVSPLCLQCPLARLCGARRLGVQDDVPAPRRRPPAQEVERAVALIRRGGRILLERSDAPATPRGLWDLPGAVVPAGDDPRRVLERALGERRLRARVGGAVASVDHAITYRRIRSTAYATRLREAFPEGESSRWFERQEIERLPIGAAARRLLSAALLAESD